VVWVGVRLGEELAEVVARQHKLPIGAHVRRSSSDEARWTSATHSGVWLVVTPDNISRPTRGPNVDATIGSTMRSRGGLRRKAPVNGTIRTMRLLIRQSLRISGQQTGSTVLSQNSICSHTKSLQ
jgi:hypothetical protein